jgi:hypothetical protein
MRRNLFPLLLSLLAVPVQADKREVPPPALTEEHAHPSGTFTFRTPAGWKASPVAGKPDVYEATDGTLVARFVWRERETGYDSLHVDCMLERLAGPMDTSPQVKYEYDFLGGVFGNRRVLDSAFAVTYDEKILGHKDWRQRNVTVVGEGLSLCIITHAPAVVWKKSLASRAVLDELVKSITFR